MPTSIRFYLVFMAVCGMALLSTGCDSSDPLEDDDPRIEEEDALVGMQRRLLVAEQGQPAVYVLDVESGEQIASLPLDGPIRAYLRPSEDGRLAFAAPTASPLQVIDGGIFENPSVPGEVMEQPPEVLPFSVPGEALVHVTVTGPHVAGFYDGTGEARVFDYRPLLDGETPSVVTLSSGRAHHGTAIALDDVGLLTRPTPDEEDILPDGVTVHSLTDGSLMQNVEVPCPRLHGSAYGQSDLVGFGCGDGVLIVEPQGGQVVATKVENPEGLPEGVRSGTLHGHENVPYLIAHMSARGENLGPAVYDPASRALEMMPFDGRSPWARGYAFSTQGEHFLALGLDGSLHVYEAATRTLRGTLSNVASALPADSLLEGFSYPGVVAGARYAYVSDPDQRRITEIDLETLDVTRQMPLTFEPGVMTLLGTDEPLRNPDPAS